MKHLFKIMARIEFQSDPHFSSFWFVMDPAQVHFLRFILEGYDNEFQMTTVVKGGAVVRILASKGAETTLIRILMEMKDKIGLNSLPLQYL